MKELYEGPHDWVHLRKMVTEGGWRPRAQQVLLMQPNSQMDLEEVSTYIQDVGTLAPSAVLEESNFLVHIVERRFDEPHPPLATSNPYYGTNIEHVTVLYEQWPCYVTSVNAEGVPTPPRPSQYSKSNPMPVIYNDAAAARHTPSASSIQAPWAPLTRADTTPVVKSDRQQLRHSNTGEGFMLWAPELRRLTGVGSQIQQLHDEVMPFLRSMTRAHMFNIYLKTQDPSPQHLLRVAASYVDVSIAASFLGSSYKTPDEVLSQVSILNGRLLAARAMYDYALLEALDACAVLGGVELPVWSPDPSYTGCWIGSIPRPSSEVDESYFLQVRARKLERWGVPLWCEIGRRAKRRYDAGPDGRPVAFREAEEQRHQQTLAALTRGTRPIPVKQVLVAVGDRIASRPVNVSSAPLPRDGEVRGKIQRAISALVDPDSSEIKTFDAFNKDMIQLLGIGVWSGRKHEFQHHHNFLNPNSKQRSRWLRIRDGVHDCGHKGVLLAAVEIPRTWYDPQTYPVDFRGVTAEFGAPPRPSSQPQPAVPVADWYVVEVAGFEKGDEAEARGIFDAYRRRGALGQRWVLCKVQKKDESGRSIRHSRYQVELLFKSLRAQGEAALSLSHEFPQLLVNQISCIGKDMAWINLFDFPMDPMYVVALFSRPLLASRQQQLLELAPPCSIPPTIADGASPEERANAERSHLGRLCHWALFEYDTRYPPSVQPASVSASTSLASISSAPSTSSAALSPASLPSPVSSSCGSGRSAQDMSQLDVERFADLAFASDCGLSDDDILRFQRLALVLQACKRRAPFSSNLFPSEGAPYRSILRHVASVVKQSSALHGYAFQSRESRQSIGPWSETLKMKSDGKVEVFINFDAPLDLCRLPRREEVDRYFEACDREHPRTRSEKRRKRQRGGNAAPQQSSAD